VEPGKGTTIAANRTVKYGLAAALAAAIVFSGGCDNTPPIEISLPPTTAGIDATQVYIGGAVNNPGCYPLQEGDSLDALIQAAGGIIDGADIDSIQITICRPDESDTPQRIDINRAEAWLLEALPGIGQVRAQAIIEYRQQHGPFSSIDQLLNVEGIGQSTLDGIRQLISVAD
jgi:competence protein ComEA